MSQPPLGDFHLPQPEPDGNQAWPPVAQRAVGCGAAAAVAVILVALAMWALMAVYVKFAPVIATTGSAPSKAASPPKAPAQTPAAKPPKPIPTHSR